MAKDKAKLYFIDSNIFLRTLVRENEKTFRDCYNFLELVQNKQIKALTSSLVLAEVNWTLGSFYKFSKEEVLSAIGSILHLRGLKIIDKTDPLTACTIFKNHNVKFIDALIASNLLISQKKVIIVSYDQDFDKLNVLRQEPKDL